MTVNIPLSIETFLLSPTPTTWVETAKENIPTLLVDHAHCEKKAASNALSFIYRYLDKPHLLNKMSKLAREELRHFEKVMEFLTKQGQPLLHLEPCQYAQGLRQHVRHNEPGRLLDLLIFGAFIEARSCERFGLIAQYLPVELKEFYQGLCAAESRHFLLYLDLANYYAQEDISSRVAYFAEIESKLINTPEIIFRFHSGPLIQ